MKIAAAAESGATDGAAAETAAALREEIVEVVTRDGDRPTAVVLRNPEGFLELAAERAIVVDVGFELVERQRTGWTLFSVMFGATAPRKRQDVPPARLDAWLAADPRRGARVYRRANGFRYLLTWPSLDAASDEAQSAMEALGADPLARRRSAVERCYRTRLTPKPSRCGVGPLGVPYPRQGADAQARHESWLAAYDAKCGRFGTCAYLGTRGKAELDSGLAPIVALHDERTRANSDLPLA
jgi:hypothetical protein